MGSSKDSVLKVYAPAMAIMLAVVPTARGFQGPLRALPVSQFSGVGITSRSLFIPSQARYCTSLSSARTRLFRVNCFSTLRAAALEGKQKLVFLGTPEVAAQSLRHLIEEAKDPSCPFEVSAVVSNPPARAGRKKQLQPSPVHQVGEEAGLPVFTPSGLLKKYEDSAAFLDSMRELQPDICVTAAYGQFLPKSFLSIPRLGTLNIHPSLLPQFRGASPVPRALEAGVPVTGVSVLFTVFEMDAGPIVAKEEMTLTGDEKADELLPILFDKGSKLLVSKLPEVIEGKYCQDGTGCEIQDDSKATHAAKMSKDEGELWFTENAKYMHNRVRAFAGWPGTTAELVLDPQGPDEEKMKVKVLTTKLVREEGGAVLGVHEIKLQGKGILVTCDDGSQLEILKLQPPGKKPMDAKSFWNGMRGRRVERARVPWSPGKIPAGADS